MQLHRRAKEIREAGASLTLIGQATPRHATHFRRRLEIDLPVLADEKRVSYKAAGAKVATAAELVSPSVVLKGARATARSGQVQGRVIGHTGQLGGTMLVRPGGEVAWVRMSQDAADNTSAKDIVAAVKAATK